ncbi:4Fe-4S binding protein [Caloranaerobacter ferrireducens]|uniref:4Fe-4S binding protein n=1 Tax=Caloranaerobacter ferrireducens TaxID=1323370 RepID=UPI000B1804BA|nr:4Fe-4S binding protein [Caloranaerobacter ferrireducens]
MDKKKITKVKPRTIVQIIFFIIIASISINHTLSELNINIPFISKASLHGLCPFGGVVSTYQFITTGTFVKKIHESSFILMLLVLLLALLFGPVFCGWICPLGSIQEWFGKIGKKYSRKNIIVL